MPGLRIKNPNYIKEFIERFHKSYEIDMNGCWIWKKSKHRQGYGHCGFKRKIELAHRVSWIIFKLEEITPDIKICHKCDNPACVNPDHLFKGTQKDNVNDCKEKNRRANLKEKYHPRSIITEKDAKEIKNLLSIGITQSKIARLFNVCKTVISKIKLNKHWTTKQERF